MTLIIECSNSVADLPIGESDRTVKLLQMYRAPRQNIDQPTSRSTNTPLNLPPHSYQNKLININGSAISEGLSMDGVTESILQNMT